VNVIYRVGQKQSTFTGPGKKYSPLTTVEYFSFY